MQTHLKELHFQSNLMTMPIDISKFDLNQKSLPLTDVSLDVNENLKNNLKFVGKVVNEINTQIKRSAFDDDCVDEAVKSAVADLKKLLKK